MTAESTIENYLLYRQVTACPRSVTIYRDVFQRFIRFLPADYAARQVTVAQISKFLCALHAEGRSGNQIVLHRKVLRAYFNWCVTHRICRRNPVETALLPQIVVAKKARHYIVADEHQLLMNAIKANPDRFPGYLPIICELAFRTGLRRSDCCMLRWDSINFDTKVLRVTPHKTRRLGKVVEIPMDDVLVKILSDHAEKPYKYYGNTPLVLPEADADWRDRQIFTAMFRRLTKLAGINPKITFHAYRHGFVSRLINSGASTIVVQSMTGHCLQELLTYSHVSNEAKRAALARAGMITKTEGLQ